MHFRKCPPGKNISKSNQRILCHAEKTADLSPVPSRRFTLSLLPESAHFPACLGEYPFGAFLPASASSAAHRFSQTRQSPAALRTVRRDFRGTVFLSLPPAGAQRTSFAGRPCFLLLPFSAPPFSCCVPPVCSFAHPCHPARTKNFGEALLRKVAGKRCPERKLQSGALFRPAFGIYHYKRLSSASW